MSLFTRLVMRCYTQRPLIGHQATTCLLEEDLPRHRPTDVPACSTDGSTSHLGPDLLHLALLPSRVCSASAPTAERDRPSHLSALVLHSVRDGWLVRCGEGRSLVVSRFSVSAVCVAGGVGGGPGGWRGQGERAVRQAIERASGSGHRRGGKERRLSGRQGRGRRPSGDRRIKEEGEVVVRL